MFIIENDLLSVFSITWFPTAEDHNYSRFSCLSYMCGYVRVYAHVPRRHMFTCITNEVQQLLSLQRFLGLS